MKNIILKIPKQILTVWGAISLTGVIAMVGYLAYSKTLGNTNIENKASTSDVRFVLNWCGLGDQKIEKVINSFTSACSFTGDHHDAYAIKITNVTVDELINSSDNRAGKWYRADNLPEILDDAVTFVCGWQNETLWFPAEESIRTQDFYVYPWSICFHGISPTAAQFIFINPSEKIIYYVSKKI